MSKLIFLVEIIQGYNIPLLQLQIFTLDMLFDISATIISLTVVKVSLEIVFVICVFCILIN